MCNLHAERSTQAVQVSLMLARTDFLPQDTSTHSQGCFQNTASMRRAELFILLIQNPSHE